MNHREEKLIKFLEQLPKKEVPPDFSSRVMTVLGNRRAGAVVFSDIKKWVVISLAAAFLGLVFLTDLPLLPQIEVTQTVGYHKVELVFYPSSQSPRTVAVAGDFSDWDSIQMDRKSGDYWKVTLQVRPGRYQYAFVVDGSLWIPDPLSSRKVADGFGGFNSVLVVNGLLNYNPVE